MSENKEVPKGWAIVKVGDVFDFIGGGTPSKKIASYWDGNICWASVKDVKNDYLKKTEDTITKEGLQNSAANLAYPEDVILITRIIPGRTIISKITTAINQDLKIVKPKFKTSPEFIRYLFGFSERECIKLASGTTVLGITLNNLNEIFVPLPPLPEQHRIVAKIEELFSSLDKGIEGLQTARQQLKVYRQAVLKWAFEGKLAKSTLQQAQGTVMPVAEPVEAIEATDKEGELPDGWKWVNSGDLFSFVTSGSRGWAKYYSDAGAVFIRITNLDFDSLTLDLEESKIQYVTPPSNSEGIRTKVCEGDFLFSITGYLGMFAIAPYLENAFVNQHIALCRPKEGFNKRFVGYWIIARTGGHLYLNKMTKGATKAGLGLDDIKNFPVPVPPLPEQHAIVAEIESRLSVCDKIEESIEQSLKQAEALRQSILKKAFEGKLVPQDPNDEPASKLLERIRAERQRDETENPPRRRPGRAKTKRTQ